MTIGKLSGQCDFGQKGQSRVAFPKSIETFTVKQKAEATGVTQEEQKTETTKTEEVNTDTDKETDITEKPAADPYRWRYIFGILVLLAVAFFFLRKTKVFTAVAAFFRKLF